MRMRVGRSTGAELRSTRTTSPNQLQIVDDEAAADALSSGGGRAQNTIAREQLGRCEVQDGAQHEVVGINQGIGRNDPGDCNGAFEATFAVAIAAPCAEIMRRLLGTVLGGFRRETLADYQARSREHSRRHPYSAPVRQRHRHLGRERPRWRALGRLCDRQGGVISGDVDQGREMTVPVTELERLDEP